MKINLGSGWKYREGWVNCDLYAERADVRCDIRTLPFESGAIDEVIFHHTIEHVPRADGLQALTEIHRVLRVGGVVGVETPERFKCIALIQGEGPKPPKLNVIEGARVATGLYYPNAKRLLNGVKGAVGGVSGTPEAKERWHAWLLKHKDQILSALIDGDITKIPTPKNVKPGEQHLYIWGEQELRQEMEAIGFAATIEAPQSHGQRTWRDCRVVGVKRE